MYRKKVDVDVVLDVLKAVLEAQPAAGFVQSLLQQYQERGGLSKRQLQGLLGKAQKLGTVPAGRLATLEAMILKKPTRFKSALPAAKPLYEKDAAIGEQIATVLAKYPQHKRVLFFRSKYENNESLTAVELTELGKFVKMVDKLKS